MDKRIVVALCAASAIVGATMTRVMTSRYELIFDGDGMLRFGYVFDSRSGRISQVFGRGCLKGESDAGEWSIDRPLYGRGGVLEEIKKRQRLEAEKKEQEAWPGEVVDDKARKPDAIDAGRASAFPELDAIDRARASAKPIAPQPLPGKHDAR